MRKYEIKFTALDEEGFCAIKYSVATKSFQKISQSSRFICVSLEGEGRSERKNKTKLFSVDIFTK